MPREQRDSASSTSPPFSSCSLSRCPSPSPSPPRVGGESRFHCDFVCPEARRPRWRAAIPRLSPPLDAVSHADRRWRGADRATVTPPLPPLLCLPPLPPSALLWA